MKHILVIRLGALGDIVQDTGGFAAIRRHHPGDCLTLLTAPAHAAMGRACPWFDRVWTDDRPGPWRPAAWLALIRRLRGARFDRVYDLQTSDRTRIYYRLLRPGRRLEWSGIGRGVSHPHTNPQRDRMHNLDRQAEQLAIAGIEPVPPPDVGWLAGEIGALRPPGAFVLLAAGSSARHRVKRWPASHFAALAVDVLAAGLTPVLLGTAADRASNARIAGLAAGMLNGGVVRRHPPAGQPPPGQTPPGQTPPGQTPPGQTPPGQTQRTGVVDLTGRTGVAQLASLARQCAGAVGNDTGPMHLIAVAAAGVPVVMLMSGRSDPAHCAPRGDHVTVLRKESLADLPVATVVRHVLQGCGQAARAGGDRGRHPVQKGSV